MNIGTRNGVTIVSNFTLIKLSEFGGCPHGLEDTNAATED